MRWRSQASTDAGTTVRTTFACLESSNPVVVVRLKADTTTIEVLDGCPHSRSQGGDAAAVEGSRLYRDRGGDAGALHRCQRRAVLHRQQRPAAAAPDAGLGANRHHRQLLSEG